MKEFFERVRERFKSGVEFIRDVRNELNKVSWPSRNELVGTTTVVIIAVFFFGFYLFVVDIVVKAGMDLLYRHAAGP